MRSKLILLAATLLTGASALAQTPTAGRTAEPVRSEKGRPLFSLIKPGQTQLIVEKDQAAPHYVEPPPGVSQLEWLTSVAPVVAVIRVDAMDPRLTADHDWIEPTVRARVEDVLKKPAGDPLAVGDFITFTQDGGEIHVRGVHIKAQLPWADSFREGGQYLVFAQRRKEAIDWLIDAASAYQVNLANDKLISLARRGKARTEEGSTLADAAARVRRASQETK
jgi:hypothetical protein